MSEQPPGKPTAGEQAKQDAANVGKDALKGAAKGAMAGGIKGAALGAGKAIVKGVAKSKTTRKIVVGVLVGAVGILIIGMQMISGIGAAVVATGSEEEVQRQSSNTVTGEGDGVEPVSVNGEAITRASLVTYSETASMGGVPWQVLLSLTQTRESAGSTVGTIGTIVDGIALDELDGCVEGVEPFADLKPNAQLVMQCGSAFVRQAFADAGADIETWHGVGARGNNPKSDHPNGRAVDAMVAHSRGGVHYAWDTPEAQEVGDALAEFYTKNAAALGIYYVIWDAQIWLAEDNEGWREYRHPSGGTNPTLDHLDHVHVSVYESGQESGAEGGEASLGDRPGRVAGGIGTYNILANEETWRTQLQRAQQHSQDNPPSAGIDTSALDTWAANNSPYPIDRQSLDDDDDAGRLVAELLGDYLRQASTIEGMTHMSGGIAQGEDRQMLVVKEQHRGEPFHTSAKEQSARQTRELYVEAISRLPIAGMGHSMAETVYDRAMAWYIGQEWEGPKKGGRCYFAGGELGEGMGAGELGSYVGKDETGATVVLQEDQLANAATIMAEAANLGANLEQIQVALMTALQESSLLMYANSTIPESLELPHQAVGSDHDSLGLFQQRLSFWGTVEELMDAEYNVQAFFGGPDGPDTPPGLFDLAEDGGLVGKTLGQQAQAVQVSAYPHAYDKWAPVAADLIQLMGDIECSSASIVVDGWARPVPESVAMNSGFGYRGNIGVPGAAPFHAGNDFAAPEGTPIFAAAAGEVLWASESPTTWWSGNLVMLDHGNGLYTTYNHIRNGGFHVEVGDVVEAGQQIAEIGMTGNASGPHLHFAVFHFDGDPFWPNQSNFFDPQEFFAEQGIIF